MFIEDYVWLLGKYNPLTDSTTFVEFTQENFKKYCSKLSFSIWKNHKMVLSVNRSEIYCCSEGKAFFTDYDKDQLSIELLAEITKA